VTFASFTSFANLSVSFLICRASNPPTRVSSACWPRAFVEFVTLALAHPKGAAKA